MNNLQVFKNGIFEVSIQLENGEILFDAETVARCLGFTTVAKSGNATIRWSRVNEYLRKIFSQDVAKGDFIPEAAVYKLAFKANNEVAEIFQDWLAIEVLPSIRKHGAYMTDNVIEQMLNNPEFGIKLLTELKAEREEKLKLQNELAYKTEIIQGITEDIDIYTKRNVLNKVVRYKKANYSLRWNELYARFREVYSVDLKARCEGYNLKQLKKKDKLSTIKYAEQFGYLDNLYKVALKLYETDIKEILEQLKEIA